MLTDAFALTGMCLGPAAIAPKRVAVSAKRPAAIKNRVRPRSLPIEALISQESLHRGNVQVNHDKR
jgi:hypothetical protein